MKRAFLFISLLTSTLLGSAQDIIEKTNGEKLYCKILHVDSTLVYYSLKRNEFGGSIKINEIRQILYGNPSVESVYNTKEYHNTLTFGILEGGGSLFGIDYERIFSSSAGIQIGVGYRGFGFGLNSHFKPTTRSSFLSLQYYHQGFGPTYTQSLIGPCFVYRGKEWLTFQIGSGYVIRKGPAWPANKTQPSIMLTYAIGWYIPY